MAKTQNIGLNLTTNDSTLFEDWQKSIDGNGSGETKSNMQIIDEQFGEVAKKLASYEVEVLSTDDIWEQVNGRWQVRILQTTHKLSKIHSIVAERKTDSDVYEKMIYLYKRYSSGSISLIVDYKVDMKITLKGEK